MTVKVHRSQALRKMGAKDTLDGSSIGAKLAVNAGAVKRRHDPRRSATRYDRFTVLQRLISCF
jgi:DNA-binding NarL/FixJ family response regulator